MYPELTNLLPQERLASVKREYFTRLASVALIALAVVIVAASALLVPSYLYLNDEIRTRETRESSIDTQLAATNAGQANTRLATLSANAQYLTRLASTSSATAAIRGVLAVPRTGIIVTSISLTPPTHGTDGRMTISGNATTREALRAYNDALGALPGVSGSDLPISAYAKESDIPFSITLTGSFSS